MKAILVLAAILGGVLAADYCRKGNPYWTTKNGNIYVNGSLSLSWVIGARILGIAGKLYVLKGVNWFGMETDALAPHGLWDGFQSMDYFINFLANNGFNTVRIPWSVEMVLWRVSLLGRLCCGSEEGTSSLQSQDKPQVGCSKNGDLCHLKPLDLMLQFVKRLGYKGIAVLLDNQRLRMKEEIPELWSVHYSIPAALQRLSCCQVEPRLLRGGLLQGLEPSDGQGRLRVERDGRRLEE